MDYVVHYSDGSKGYLAHYGVKGMKWGVWNEETRARRSGRKFPLDDYELNYLQKSSQLTPKQKKQHKSLLNDWAQAVYNESSVTNKVTNTLESTWQKNYLRNKKYKDSDDAFKAFVKEQYPNRIEQFPEWKSARKKKIDADKKLSNFEEKFLEIEPGGIQSRWTQKSKYAAKARKKRIKDVAALGAAIGVGAGVVRALM